MTDPEITQEDLFDFFQAHSADCNVCGSNSWGVTDPEDPILLIFHNFIRDTSVSPRGIPTYGAACQNCGYMRLHAAVVVESWIEENRASKNVDRD